MPKAKLTVPYFCIIVKTTQESLWRYLAQDVAYETGNNIWVVENVSAWMDFQMDKADE